MSIQQLTGRTVVVTGAAGTIGSAVVARMRHAGAEVVAVDLAAGPEVEACDVLDEIALAALISKYSMVTDLVHAAGTVHVGSIVQTSAAEVERILRVNLLSTFILGRLVLPALPAGGKCWQHQPPKDERAQKIDTQYPLDFSSGSLND